MLYRLPHTRDVIPGADRVVFSMVLAGRADSGPMLGFL